MFSSLPNVSVTAIDSDPKTAAAAAWPYRANWSADFDAVLPELDAVVIATPPASHYTLAAAALAAGCHAMVEKPLTTNTADGEQLVNAAADANLTLMVGHTFVSNDAVRALHHYVNDAEFGQLRYLDSARLNLGLYQGDVNVLWDLAPHDISIFNYLAGESPTKVSAWASQASGELADAAYLRLTYPSGLIGTVHVSWVYPTKVRRVTAVGDSKMAVYDDTAEERLSLYDRRVSGEGSERQYHLGDTSLPAIDFREPLKVQAEEFVHCIRTGTLPLADGKAGLDVVRVLCAADLAIAESEDVAVGDAQIPIDASSLLPRRDPTGPDVDSLQAAGYQIAHIEPDVRVVLAGPNGDEVILTFAKDGSDR